ncbi:hypothetical protein KUL156_10770 [Alteromonas sp. KUL156]|nr:hypothetical protein KUL154_42930 [Alteromonas sp. KUL154]GFD98484.1 hypothetical protein KUL156_10770 [Alteromonas sp. KUL156]
MTQRLNQFIKPLFTAAFAASLAFGCTPKTEKPEKTSHSPEFNVAPSTIAIEVIVDLESLEEKASESIPTELVRVDQNINACVPKKQAKVCVSPNLKCNKKFRYPGGWTCIGWKQTGCGKYLITDTFPQLDCKVTGKVTRGNFTVFGQDDNLVVSAPIKLNFKAYERGDLGKLAPVYLDAGADIIFSTPLGVAQDWGLNSEPQLNYRWTSPPQLRIGVFTFDAQSHADRAISDKRDDVIEDLKATIQNIDLKTAVQSIWSELHKPILIGPPDSNLWLNMTPESIGISDITFNVNEALFSLTLNSQTEVLWTKEKPISQKKKTSLPQLSESKSPKSLRLNLPMNLSFERIKTGVNESLKSNNTFAINDESIGNGVLTIKGFDIYQTNNDSLAVGLEIEAKFENEWFSTDGTVWTISRPEIDTSRRAVIIKDFDFLSLTNNDSLDTLVHILRLPYIRKQITEILVFEYGSLLNESIEEYIDMPHQFSLNEEIKGQITFSSFSVLDSHVFGDGIRIRVGITGESKIRYATK